MLRLVKKLIWSRAGPAIAAGAAGALAALPRRPGKPVHGGAITNLGARLFAPADIRPLVYFRVAFGTIAFWEVCRYFHHGWIDRTYVKSKIHFTYAGFHWLRPWPSAGMRWHFLGLGATSLMIASGLWYRPASILFATGFTYVFLLERSRYLNHFYLFSLISWLMTIVPAHRAGSLDAWRRPELRSGTTPAWTIWLLAGQVAVAYFFGGVAKINPDWLRGEPMRTWLRNNRELPAVARLARHEWFVGLFVYGGLLFDLLVVPLLLSRRTLPYTLPMIAAFNLANARLFRIGIFPWFMLAATVLFVPPSWLPWPRQWRNAVPTPAPQPLTSAQQAGMAALGAYALAQILIPLRHHLYPGNVSWTEEGHRFAWHMKLRSKRGVATFRVTDPASGKTWTVEPGKDLIRAQSRRLATQPDMIVQYAHHLARRFAAGGYPGVEVRADVLVSLNGRQPQVLIDPEVDLARVRLSLRPAPWIVPLTEPLPSRRPATPPRRRLPRPNSGRQSG